jgi:signal transduction histidine kinase
MAADVFNLARHSFAMRTPFILYTATLAMGLLADFICCHVASVPNFCLALLPGLYYVGILVAAITFGTAGGLGAAALAAICHTSAGFVCRQSVSGGTEIFVFALIALTAGWLTHSRRSAGPSGDQQKRGQDAVMEHTVWKPASMNRPVQPEPTRAGLIHQLRTPVASIEGAIYLLDEPNLPDAKCEEFADIVRRECSRLQTLLESLESRQPQL